VAFVWSSALLECTEIRKKVKLGTKESVSQAGRGKQKMVEIMPPLRVGMSRFVECLT